MKKLVLTVGATLTAFAAVAADGTIAALIPKVALAAVAADATIMEMAIAAAAAWR